MTNIKTDVVKYNITDAEIVKYKKICSSLEIKSINDIEGYNKVTDAIKGVKLKSREIEKTRVELKAEALKYSQAVDSEARRIQSELFEIITDLNKIKDPVDLEVARIKKFKEQQSFLPDRHQKLVSINVEVTDEELLNMDQIQFLEFYNTLKEQYLLQKECEQQEKEAEAKQKAAKEEQDRLIEKK